MNSNSFENSIEIQNNSIKTHSKFKIIQSKIQNNSEFHSNSFEFIQSTFKTFKFKIINHLSNVSSKSFRIPFKINTKKIFKNSFKNQENHSKIQKITYIHIYNTYNTHIIKNIEI